MAKALEQYSPYWFDEPVSPENLEQMARVAAHTSIPIATGERLVTKCEFAQVLHKQAAQIIQLDVGQCGGILESKKIASMAEAHDAVIAPHMCCCPVAAAAAPRPESRASPARGGLRYLAVAAIRRHAPAVGHISAHYPFIKLTRLPWTSQGRRDGLSWNCSPCRRLSISRQQLPSRAAS